LLMFPMSTASNVYPGPTGTMGKFKVILPSEVGTLLAMAKALLNDGLSSSRENVVGSPAAVVH